MGEVILEAFLHSLKLLPFLFLIYVFIEVIEEKTTYNFKKNKLLKGWCAPVFGAGVGIIPQCGFSIVAANLFTQKKLTLGALLAVFIATSDEAVPILLSNPQTAAKLLPLLLTKFLFALVVGYSVDLGMYVWKKHKFSKAVESDKNNNVVELEIKEQLDAEAVCSKDLTDKEVSYMESNITSLEDCVEEHSHEHEHEHVHTTKVGCCGHSLGNKKEKPFKAFVVHPLIHSLKIFLYILIMNMLLNILIFYITKDRICEFLTSNILIGPILATTVGLIPNCFSSVVITELYAMGALNFGSCIAGLSVNAGLGMLVLFKENKNVKQNVAIIVGLYVVSVLFGLLLNVFIK